MKKTKVASKTLGIVLVCLITGSILVNLPGLATAARATPTTPYEHPVPHVWQRDYDYENIGWSCCGPASVTMLLRYYFPNGGVDVPEVYHSGIQGYSYHGPAIGYKNVSFVPQDNGSPEYVNPDFRNCYHGKDSGMYSGAAAHYLSLIWGGQAEACDASVLEVLNEIKERPLILNVWRCWTEDGQEKCGGHYVVLRGYDDKGTPEFEDDLFHINNPVEKEPTYWSYEDFLERYRGKIVTFRPTLSENQREHTVVVDNNHVKLDDPDARDEDGNHVWREFYGLRDESHHGDWYYPTQDGHSAKWVPDLSIEGNYEVHVIFRKDEEQTDVTYAIYDGQEMHRKTVSQNGTGWSDEGLGTFSLRKGCYVQVDNVPAQCNADAVRFEYVGSLQPPTRPPTRNLDVVLAIDRSGSMSGQKIVDARDAAITFVNLLENQDKVGLVPFSTDATLDCPLTSDFEYAKSRIETYEAGGYTNMGDALNRSISELRASGRDDTIRTIIYFTDGKTNEGPSRGQILDLASEAAEDGIIIYTLGYGGDVNSTFLSQVANAANGKYYFAPDSAGLMEIYVELSQQAKAMNKSHEFRGTVSSVETGWERFWVELKTIFIRIFLIWPGSDLDLVLIDPSGTTIEPGMPGVTYSGNTLPEYYEIYDPEPGEWIVGIYGKDVTGTTEDYTVMVFQPCALMQVRPTRCEIDYPANTMASLVVSEIGGMVDLEDVVFTASELTKIGGGATIPSSGFTFSENQLTIPAGCSQEVHASLTIGPDTAIGDYSGSITVTAEDNTTTITVVARITNRPPVADAGTGMSWVAPLPAARATVTLDGSSSYDPDGDLLNYTWSYEGNTASGVNPVVELPWGTTTVTLVVSDGTLDSAADTVEITVEPAPPVRGLTNLYQWFALGMLILFAGASLWVLLRSVRFRS